MNNSPCSNIDADFQDADDLLNFKRGHSTLIEPTDSELSTMGIREQLMDLYLNVKIRKTVLKPGFYE